MPTPDEARLGADLDATTFQVGVDAGMWDLVDLTWPFAVFTISAGDGRKVAMRLNFDGYPAVAPAGQLWDIAANALLSMSRWPIGGTAEATFRRDWPPGSEGAPYLATERLGLSSHSDWTTGHQQRAWNSSRAVDFYLSEVYRNLRTSTIPE